MDGVLRFACTQSCAVSHLTAMITNIFCSFSVKVAGLKPAISPCWLDVFYILNFTACSFNTPHSTKPIYFSSTNWPLKASLTRPPPKTLLLSILVSTAFKSHHGVLSGLLGGESKEWQGTNPNLGELPSRKRRPQNRESLICRQDARLKIKR